MPLPFHLLPTLPLGVHWDKTSRRYLAAAAHAALKSPLHSPIDSLPLDRIPLPRKVLAIVPNGTVLSRIAYGWVVTAVGAGFDQPVRQLVPSET